MANERMEDLNHTFVIRLNQKTSELPNEPARLQDYYHQVFKKKLVCSAQKKKKPQDLTNLSAIQPKAVTDL